MSKKKKSIKKLHQKADELWKQAVLKNYQGKCYVCGSKFMVDAHHFIPRRISLALRYDLENGVALCRKCHTALHWKSDPLISLIIAFKKGKEWISYLEKKKNQKVIPNKKWYQKQIKNLAGECE